MIKQCTPTPLEEERGHESERKQLLKSARVAWTCFCMKWHGCPVEGETVVLALLGAEQEDNDDALHQQVAAELEAQDDVTFNGYGDRAVTGRDVNGASAICGRSMCAGPRAEKPGQPMLTTA